MNNETLYWLLTGSIPVTTFFLIRFFFLVDEIRKDVKQLLVNGAARDVEIENLKDDMRVLQLKKSI